MDLINHGITLTHTQKAIHIKKQDKKPWHWHVDDGGQFFFGETMLARQQHLMSVFWYIKINTHTKENIIVLCKPKR